MHNLSTRKPMRRLWGGLLLAGLLLAGIWATLHWWPAVTSVAAQLTAPDPVTAAWEKARAAGSYHFTSDVLQKTIPVASIANVGRGSRSEALYLEGQNDLHAQSLELTLWSQTGSALNADSGVSLRTENGKSFTRRGNEAWQESNNVTEGFAPGGDFLGYLAAIRDVTPGTSETRSGITFTRYSFTLDGPAFAAYMHEQLLAALRAKGELPPGVQLEAPAYYRDMTGRGELWIGENGLPVRQILDLRFPEQNEERVEAAITVNFANYGVEQSGLWTLLRSGQWQGAWLVLPSRLPDLTGLWLGLALSVAALLVIRYRRARALQTAIVSAVIISQVAGPLLSTTTQTRFFDSYRAKATAQKEQQTAATQARDLHTAMQRGPEFDPQENPVAAGGQDDKMTGGQGDWQIATQSPDLLVSPSPSLQVTDPGTDTDGDGLSDFLEVRIGSSEVYSDTDDDGLSDNLEVNGFTMGGQTWYTNPTVADSNNDGQSDIVEWGINDATGLPQATPRDTDGDGLPDLFDPDNDNDGVPDRVDSAPYAKGAATYSDTNPLQLRINNLTPDQPTFVEFQIRPQDPKNLWFAHHVLDWPQDSDGQVRDVDGKTYADVAAAQGRTPVAGDENGDMKLLPMLEIRIPAASANLPSQAELTPFNITVNDFTTDGSTLVAYAPLALVTDPLSGERVAFSGQMRYKPTGSWSTPHSVRLAWVVQGLNDLPCDPEVDNAAAQGCQRDSAGRGYIYNQPMMVHSYYDDWTLTGLSVREEHGTSMAVLYEDPAVDPDKKDEAPLWALTTALDEHFLKPRDTDNNTVRDLALSNFPARFDRDNNPSEAQRFGIPNILQVVSNSYPTSDEAAMTTAMTTTTTILESAFKASVQADNAIKPLLLFVTEQKLRAVGLDQVAAGTGYATQSGAAVTLDLSPTPADALAVTVSAGLKWMAYCGANGNNVTWRGCTSDEYADVIEARYANAPALPDDSDPAEVPGRMMLALAYYFTLVGSYQAQVQEGAEIVAGRYSLEGESDTTARIRIALDSVSALPQVVVVAVIHLNIVVSTGKTAIPNLTATQMIKETIARLGDTHYSLKTDKATGFTATGIIPPTEAQIRAVKLPKEDTLPREFARLFVGAVVGSALMLLLTTLSQSPDLDVPTRAVLGAIGAAVTIGVSLYIPAATMAAFYQFRIESAIGENRPKPSFAKTLNWNLIKLSAAKTAFAVGLVVNVALIWGFFAYAASTSGYAAGSPELNKAAAEAIAATLVAIFLAVLSATFIGLIIVSIIAVIDTILNLVCELGVDELRLQGNFYGGACFSITTTATKVVSYFLYNYEPMIDTSRSDLMIAGTPNVTLADPTKGYVPDNTLTLNLPVTTTVIHKDPDPSNGLYINLYLWLYSQENLRSSTFKYGLSQGAAVNQAVDLNQMPGAWQDVREDHKYLLTPMYRGVAVTNPAPLAEIPLTQGINSSIPFSLTMNFAVPAYECFLIPIPYGPIIVPTPVCHTREFENANTTPFTVLKYDVLPNTLSDFVALTNKTGPAGASGLGQRWDARFPALADADGDGLRSSAFRGLDPNDTTWDADGDGLSDRFELNQRVAGVGYSPLQLDTDGDGLTDKQEAEIGTDPAVADTDNDGLSDGQEVRHQVYDANGTLTTGWAGGWQVTINSTPARTVWVSSDPFNADGDQDGISDQAEKELAANAALRVDDNGIPYHPNVPNTPLLTILTDSNAFGRYIGPNQQLYYTTTVIANTALPPGVLNVTVPANQNFAPLPAVLPFDPLTFSGSQTVTQGINFTAQPVGALGTIDLQSTARLRLPSSSGEQWTADPIALGAPLSGFTAPLTARNSVVAPARADRGDSYLLNLLTKNTDNPALGDVRSFNLTTGAGTVLANTNLVNSTSYTARVSDGIDLAGSNFGTNVAVWDQDDYCQTLTINAMRVVTAGSDGGTSGIEPFITLVTNDRTTSERIWFWTDATGGGTDIASNSQLGPGAMGFPVTRTLCGLTDLEIWESDSPNINNPIPSDLVARNVVDLRSGYYGTNYTMLFEGNGHRIDLNINMPQKDVGVVAGALLNRDGGVQSALTFPRPNIPTDDILNLHNPVVASNGDGFLVLYEARASGGNVYLVAQVFNRNGVPSGTNYRLAVPASITPAVTPTTVYDLVWLGDRYRVVWKEIGGNTIYTADINSGGTFQGSGWTTLVTDAAANNYLSPSAELFNVPHLAYDPMTTHWLLTYNRTGGIQIAALLYPGRSVFSAGAGRTFPGDTASAAAYHAQTGGWMVGTYQNSVLKIYPLAADLADLVSYPTGNPPFQLTTGSSAPGNALACPMIGTAPASELRFEELPGATSFVNSSASGGSATCTGDSCPAAGLPGAPGAPQSDYAVRFDGVNDRLILGNAGLISNDKFTYAFWMKAAPGDNTGGYLFANGNPPPASFALALNGGNLQFFRNNTPYLTTNGLNLADNQWHFVAATYDVYTPSLTLYVDGAQVATRTATSLSFTNVKVIGADYNGGNAFKGSMDHLQYYDTALSADTIQALYNRTLQSYCVASGVSADGANVRWGKMTIRENDLRGGQITASGGLQVIVDNSAPTAQMTSHAASTVIAPDTVIGGTASDNGVGVGKVEVSVEGGPWQLATGTNSWSFLLTGLNNNLHGIRVRATDLFGNVGAPSPTIFLVADASGPNLVINTTAATIKPTKNGAGQWQVPINGTVFDNRGLKANSLLVNLTQASGVGIAQSQQVATIALPSWNLSYLLDPGLYDPTGSYTVTAQVSDNVGNQTNAAQRVIRLDATGPVAAFSAVDGARTVITDTLTIGGVVSDTNSIVGIDKLEIAFTPIDQIAALPVGFTSTQAEAQLNRQWLPVTLAQRGAGVAQTTWSVAIPTGLEDSYQIDLRGTDMLGNVSITSGLWRGIIDTRDPRVLMTANATGATYVDTADDTLRHAVQFVCAVQDRNLDESSFACPGLGLAEPVRSFESIPALQALFPDLTLRSGLAISYTLWTTTPNPAAGASACDSFGRCAAASTGSVASGQSDSRTVDSKTVDSKTVAAAATAAPGAPVAVIVNPTEGSFMAANNVVAVTVAAEAAALLKEVAIKLDNVTVQTLSFSQGEAVTRTVRTLNLPIANEGQHTLVAQATAWDNSTQSALFPVTFTLDENEPTVTINASALTIADTWVAQSGVLRFNGNASDSVGLAAVQIKEGDGDFTDATFGGGTWRVALPVTDPEGRTLNIIVRAIDRSGRVSNVTQSIGTNLSAADAPDTTIAGTPTNPGATNTAAFAFSGTASAVAFDCQLDEGPYEPCASPVTYSELSKGSHTFRVRAIDGRGYPDLSPAAYSWTINASALDATIGSAPTDPSNSRTATFTFTGTGSSLECSLDGAAFAACSSPRLYTELSNGEHTFLVRARSGGNVGAAARHLWTVVNVAPVASGQTVNTTQDNTVAITLAATDEDALTYDLVPPANGLLLGIPPALTYAPNTGFVGTDSFSFVANDGEVDSNVATITVNVSGSSVTAVAPAVSIARSNSDLLLSWTPNPANSGYQLHRSTTPAFTPSAATLLTTLNATATGYTDAGAAPTPATGYYYIVRALASSSTADAVTVAALSYSLNNAGDQYSLIGLPFLPAGVSDAAGLATTIGDVSALLAWNPATQTMRFFAPPSSGDNFALTPGMAIFVVVNSGGPSAVTLTGVVGPLQQTLTADGFNFITVPLDQAALTSASALATDIGNVQALLAWNASTQLFRFFTPPSSGDDFAVQPGMPVIVNLPAGAPISWPVDGQ